jgi:hypothetical protein
MALSADGNDFAAAYQDHPVVNRLLGGRGVDASARQGQTGAFTRRSRLADRVGQEALREREQYERAERDGSFHDGLLIHT